MDGHGRKRLKLLEKCYVAVRSRLCSTFRFHSISQNSRANGIGIANAEAALSADGQTQRHRQEKHHLTLSKLRLTTVAQPQELTVKQTTKYSNRA